MLAPLARPGYVLRYDMVFVPRQPLRADLLAPADTLPRAVPLDALVSLSATVAPGWLVQRIVLAAILAAAALGAARLVPSPRTGTRLVAALAYAWTPFLAERLLLGQWGLLLCYAALPWLVRAARDVRRDRPGAGARLLLAAAFACLTPTGGLIALATTLILTWPPRRSSSAGEPVLPPPFTQTGEAVRPNLSTPTGEPVRPHLSGPTGESSRGRPSAWSSAHGNAGRAARARYALPAGVLALNAPWLLAAAASAAPGQSDPAGVAAFAARSENWGGTLLALAGTGGIWNAQAVPVSRTTVVAPLFTLGLLVATVAGVGTLRRRWPAGFANRLALLSGGTLLLAAAGALPGTSGLLRAAVIHVPGAGLLRDGQKFLIPYALGIALCAALAAERLADRLSTRVSAAAGRMVLVGAALLPIAMLPDLAWGVGGKLRPVPYPADWAAVAREVAAAPGPVVSLPMSAYRSYPWNPGAPVLDPAARYLPAPVITDDRLRVGDAVIAGENHAAAAIRDRLAAGRPVADAGVRWVLLQRDTVPPAALTGLVPVVRGPDLQLYRNPGYRPSEPATPSPFGYLLAAAVFAGALCRRVASPGAARWGGIRRAASEGTGRERGQPATERDHGQPATNRDYGQLATEPRNRRPRPVPHDATTDADTTNPVAPLPGAEPLKRERG